MAIQHGNGISPVSTAESCLIASTPSHWFPRTLAGWRAPRLDPDRARTFATEGLQNLTSYRTSKMFKSDVCKVYMCSTYLRQDVKSFAVLDQPDPRVYDFLVIQSKFWDVFGWILARLFTPVKLSRLVRRRDEATFPHVKEEFSRNFLLYLL